MGNPVHLIDLRETQNVRRAAISFVATPNNTLVAAVTGRRIRVVDIFLMAAGTLTVTFQSGAGGTNLTGAISLVANVGFAPGFNPIGHFETARSTLLNAATSAGIQCSGWLTYVLVPEPGVV